MKINVKEYLFHKPACLVTGFFTLSMIGTVLAENTLPPQLIFSIDTLANGKGVLISFDEGEKLEGCNSSNVFIAESQVLDRTLSIALSAYFANQKIQFNISGCAEEAMQGIALSLAKSYSVPGTRFTIASNVTTANLAELIDPNSASIFYITVDHNTILRGAKGAPGVAGSNGAQGAYGTHVTNWRGGRGGAGSIGGNGSAGGWAINLAGFSGKQVTIINSGLIIAGNGGNGGVGGRGGKGGSGKGYSPTKPRCPDKFRPWGPYDGYPGGSGGAGAVGGAGGVAGVAIINTEGVDLSLTGNSIVAAIDGEKGTNGAYGATGAHGARGYYCGRDYD